MKYFEKIAISKALIQKAQLTSKSLLAGKGASNPVNWIVPGAHKVDMFRLKHFTREGKRFKRLSEALKNK